LAPCPCTGPENLYERDGRLNDVIVIDKIGKEIIGRVRVGKNKIAVPAWILSLALGLTVYVMLNREF
jgi:hypothetical protein